LEKSFSINCLWIVFDAGTESQSPRYHGQSVLKNTERTGVTCALAFKIEKTRRHVILRRSRRSPVLRKTTGCFALLSITSWVAPVLLHGRRPQISTPHSAPAHHPLHPTSSPRRRGSGALDLRDPRLRGDDRRWTRDKKETPGVRQGWSRQIALGHGRPDTGHRKKCFT